jgi:hypothetical protein
MSIYKMEPRLKQIIKYKVEIVKIDGLLYLHMRTSCTLYTSVQYTYGYLLYHEVLATPVLNQSLKFLNF